ncbi:MAG: Maf family nucleotide pyrophosphatase [Prevotellaceae bacterium]|jgi:septum formation protein|nr:Maf family nucleotide pyrophosphatase [Prevotellaceae bacterium]
MLHEKLKSYTLILASQSPRRQELIKGLDVAFTVAAPYHVDETFPAAMPKDEVPVFLARLKSERYPQALGTKDILITADTLVWCKNEFLGKPKDEADARRMLRLMSGSVHEVLTGVCLRSSQKTVTFLSSTQVRFRQLGEDEISYYLSAYRPYDKAGAYGIQEWIGYAAIERIEGSYYNVMGLPIQRLYVELAKLTESLAC